MHKLRHFKEQRLRAVLCRARCVSFVTLALALPGVAYPYSLQQLLRLPLENLLLLEISKPGKASFNNTHGTAVPPRAGASRG